MIETSNNYAGANFSYDNEKDTCLATGDYKTMNGQLTVVNVNGQYKKGDGIYNFNATRDAEGNINITGVPASVLSPVASEVTKIMAAVEDLVNPK